MLIKHRIEFRCTDRIAQDRDPKMTSSANQGTQQIIIRRTKRLDSTYEKSKIFAIDIVTLQAYEDRNLLQIQGGHCIITL